MQMKKKNEGYIICLKLLNLIIKLSQVKKILITTYTTLNIVLST